MPLPPVPAINSDGSRQVPTVLVSGLDGVLVRLFTRLRTRRGEALSDTLRGLPWDSWQARKAVPLAEIRAEVRTQGGLVAGVREVVSVTATRSGGGITCTLRVTFTEDETASADVSVTDPYLTAGPSPWYTISRRFGGQIVGA